MRVGNDRGVSVEGIELGGTNLGDALGRHDDGVDSLPTSQQRTDSTSKYSSSDLFMFRFLNRKSDFLNHVVLIVKKKKTVKKEWM